MAVDSGVGRPSDITKAGMCIREILMKKKFFFKIPR